jgi:hypothetical protein
MKTIEALAIAIDALQSEARKHRYAKEMLDAGFDSQFKRAKLYEKLSLAIETLQALKESMELTK